MSCSEAGWDTEVICDPVVHFGGESPAFFTLNFRMNEVTAAIDLAQLSRVREYIEIYNACLKHLTMRATEEEGKQAAEKIHAAIEIMNKG